MLPCVIFEDEHLLVVNKPAGMNTHSPAPHAGEGIYDWLRNCEPRWTDLAIVHRLDKETSGLLLFTKTPLANRSLTAQFTARTVHKHYVLATDRAPQRLPITARSALVRAGERYLGRPLHKGAEVAETRFSALDAECGRLVLGAGRDARFHAIQAEPVTGRTHQIRVQAAELGFPILGDTLYGGCTAPRVCLHAARLRFTHPETGQELAFESPVDFRSEPSAELRRALIPTDTGAYRAVHGGSDGCPGVYVDVLADHALVQSEHGPSEEQLARFRSSGGVYFKSLSRHVRRIGSAEASPRLVQGTPAADPFLVRENGITYELSFTQGYSVGLFLDQRDNRRRLLTRHIGAGFPLVLDERGENFSVLNAFAYTCAFSVCAAKAGARTTSLDLSRKYLDWGRRNFQLNGLRPEEHDFIYGDVFEWLRRLHRKGRTFDVVLVDPPTFSQSRESGVFRVERDYGRLATAALAVLRSGGVLFCSSNAAGWAVEDFLTQVSLAVKQAGRSIVRQLYCPQPPDFRISRREPAYLKTVWMRVS